MKTLQKLTSVLLIMAVLLFSIGLTMNKMVCLKSGKIKISLHQVKNCCKEKTSDQTTIKSNCCDISSAFFGLDNYSVSEINAIHLSDIGNVLLGHNHFGIADTRNQKAPLYYGDPPPPFHGRKLLSFISILKI